MVVQPWFGSDLVRNTEDRFSRDDLLISKSLVISHSFKDTGGTVLEKFEMSLLVRKPVLGISDLGSHTIRAVQPQKTARGLKLRI